MRFSVGYRADPVFREAVLSHPGVVTEVYFAWPGIASGRTGQGGSAVGREASLLSDLRVYASRGLSLNLLLNGNCYGRQSLSRSFHSQVGEVLEYLRAEVGVSSVTTASPVMARFVRLNFPEVEVRGSVNLGIGTEAALEHLDGLFDAVYARRELNYDLGGLTALREACVRRGLRLLVLANSGCLNDCPARTFHDNLVAHENEIAEMDNAFAFEGLCHQRLSTAEGRAELLRHSNAIRPEDVWRYESLCDGMKLATRASRQAATIVDAYATGRHSGNLLDLTEPSYSAHYRPYVLSGDRLPSDYWERRTGCGGSCAGCGWCRDALRAALVDVSGLGGAAWASPREQQGDAGNADK